MNDPRKMIFKRSYIGSTIKVLYVQIKSFIKYIVINTGGIRDTAYFIIAASDSKADTNPYHKPCENPLIFSVLELNRIGID